MDYELVWYDEFDYTGPPDPEKWICETGGHGWGNNELQYYTENGNAWVENGRLIIEARQEEKEGRSITSARLKTRGKGDWLYGIFEIRAKIPRLKGTWPAIWMLPTDWEYGRWPESGEIDIMEHVAFDPERIHATIHTGAFNHKLRTHIGKSKIIPGATENFHVYSVEWLPEMLIFRVDGETQFIYNPKEHADPVTKKEWPFDKRFHLLINLAFGGNWGGSKGIEPEGLPARFEIDYVRVYQIV